MDLQKVRFYINPDLDKNLSEILILFQILTAKKFSDLEYDAIGKNGMDFEDGLLVITLDHFESMLSNFQQSLDNLIYSGRNKILVLGNTDSEYRWRYIILREYGNYLEKLPNIFRTSDTPTPINPKTALSVHTPFISRVDHHGLHLINGNLENRNNFFCLMNRRRAHRDELILSLKNYDLITKGLVVYHEFPYPEAFHGMHYQKQFSDLSEFNPAEEFEWQDFKINRYYNEFLLELVTETRFDFVSPTEKIMKPIAAGMPFLVISCPGLLKYMQDLGFRTYNEFFDESYNDEPDMVKQCDRACKLLKELIDSNSLAEIYRSSRHIVDHNREVLAKIHVEFYPQQFNNLLEYIKRI